MTYHEIRDCDHSGISALRTVTTKTGARGVMSGNSTCLGVRDACMASGQAYMQPTILLSYSRLPSSRSAELRRAPLACHRFQLRALRVLEYARFIPRPTVALWTGRVAVRLLMLYR